MVPPVGPGVFGTVGLVMLFALAILESATLTALLLAVPLKHVMHQPQYVAVLGPVHGMVFARRLAPADAPPTRLTRR